MDENPCKISQESDEFKSREISYYSEDFSSLLRDISRKNLNRIKIGQININSIRNNFDLLVPAVVRNLEILLVTYRVDRDCHEGGILLYIRQDIPSKLLINL